MIKTNISTRLICSAIILTSLIATPLFAQSTKNESSTTITLTKAELEKLKKEKDAIDAKYKILQARQKLELANSKAEIEKLSVQKNLMEKRFEEKYATDREEMAKTKVRIAKEKLAFKESLRKLKEEHEKQKVENDLKAEKQRVQKLQNESEKNKTALEEIRIKNRQLVLKLQTAELSNRAKKYEQSIAIRTKRESWESQATRQPIRKKKPFSKGTLVISDRRIPLNGPIVWGVASRITKRLHYFNNKSDEPIFLVIDYCPGGSVMEGYRILKAIEASKAPVHVVVKSFAASMAAVITTLADESYAYPNAVILHHEMSTRHYGNMTNLKEKLEKAREWEKRLMGPVAKKIGMSVEQFRKKMYENNSEGDWNEFADKAKKLGWVKHLVSEIQETGIIKDPDTPGGRSSRISLAGEEKRDSKGNRYVELPQLSPFDMYAIFNPDNYYR